MIFVIANASCSLALRMSSLFKQVLEGWRKPATQLGLHGLGYSMVSITRILPSFNYCAANASRSYQVKLGEG
jgi:hypothetical protein